MISRTQVAGDTGVMPPRQKRVAPAPDTKLEHLTKNELIMLCAARGVHSKVLVDPTDKAAGYKPLSKHQPKGYYFQQLRGAGKLTPLTDKEVVTLTPPDAAKAGEEEDQG
jgi:hypothetical protein